MCYCISVFCDKLLNPFPSFNPLQFYMKLQRTYCSCCVFCFFKFSIVIVVVVNFILVELDHVLDLIALFVNVGIVR